MLQFLGEGSGISLQVVQTSHLREGRRPGRLILRVLVLVRHHEDQQVHHPVDKGGVERGDLEETAAGKDPGENSR